MKLGPVTTLNKRKKETSKKKKKNDDDVMSANCDIIVIFPIFDQSGTIRKPDLERIIR